MANPKPFKWKEDKEDRNKQTKAKGRGKTQKTLDFSGADGQGEATRGQYMSWIIHACPLMN